MKKNIVNQFGHNSWVISNIFKIAVRKRKNIKKLFVAIFFSINLPGLDLLKYQTGIDFTNVIYTTFMSFKFLGLHHQFVPLWWNAVRQKKVLCVRHMCVWVCLWYWGSWFQVVQYLLLTKTLRRFNVQLSRHNSLISSQ